MNYKKARAWQDILLFGGAFVAGVGVWGFDSTFLGLLGLAMVLLSRLTAIREKCPVTIFLICGIFPLVPGSYVYWTAYYFVTDQMSLAAENGYMAIKIAFAIVLGIVFVFEIPQRAFISVLGKKNMQ